VYLLYHTSNYEKTKEYEKTYIIGWKRKRNKNTNEKNLSVVAQYKVLEIQYIIKLTWRRY
jgi:hypothetical protein